MKLDIGDIAEVISLDKEAQDKMDFPKYIESVQKEGLLCVVYSIREDYATVIFADTEVQEIPLNMLKLYEKGE